MAPQSHNASHGPEDEGVDASDETLEWGNRGVWDDDDEELKHRYSVLDSFRQYRRRAHLSITHRRRQAFYALPQAHQALLSAPPINFLENLSQVDDALDCNANLAEAIYQIALQACGLDDGEDSESHNPGNSSMPRDAHRGLPNVNVTDTRMPRRPWHNTATPRDIDKAFSTIRHLYRDWTAEGAHERSLCNDLVIKSLTEDSYPGDPSLRRNIRVLVPGAGTARLVFELAQCGFAVEGNEVSYHQSFASALILNCSTVSQQWGLYPFVDSFANLRKRSEQFIRCGVPDICPSQARREYAEREGSEPGPLSMSVGEFCNVYGPPEEGSDAEELAADADDAQHTTQKDQFDVVVTVFFIDTASNLIRYLETIRHCLKPGGEWINVGPLLWHHGDDDDGEGDGTSEEQWDDQTKAEKKSVKNGGPEPGSWGHFELASDEILELVKSQGFDIKVLNHSPGKCGYNTRPTSMLRYEYYPTFWKAIKKEL